MNCKQTEATQLKSAREKNQTERKADLDWLRLFDIEKNTVIY